MPCLVDDLSKYFAPISRDSAAGVPPGPACHSGPLFRVAPSICQNFSHGCLGAFQCGPLFRVVFSMWATCRRRVFNVGHFRASLFQCVSMWAAGVGFFRAQTVRLREKKSRAQHATEKTIPRKIANFRPQKSHARRPQALSKFRKKNPKLPSPKMDVLPLWRPNN